MPDEPIETCAVCGTLIRLRATPLGERESCQNWCSLGDDERDAMKAETDRLRVEQKKEAAAQRAALRELRAARKEA